MNIIVTIADRNYLKYASRLHASVRASGWRGEFCILTTEDDIYCNCTVKHIERICGGTTFDDDRWLQFEVLDHFEEGDRILYLDADMISLPDCDFDFMFDHDLLLSMLPIYEYDVTNELPDMTIEIGHEVEFKYIMAPAVFTVGDRLAVELFEKAIESIPISDRYGRGSLFALNIAAYNMRGFNPMLFPNDKVVYSVDINLGNKFEFPWFVHYGGGCGKQQWEEEYGGKDLGYMA